MLGLVGCAQHKPLNIKNSQMTPLEISTMQTREYDITRRLAFDSTMGMFQDMGYIIDNADWDTGLIAATQRGRDDSAFFKVNEQHQASVFIRSMGEKKVKIRINIRRQASGEKTSLGNTTSLSLGVLFFPLNMLVPTGIENFEDDSVILNPAVYQSIFNKLENSLFVTNE